MREIWQKIETWLIPHAMPVFESLREGASKQEIASFEATLGCSIPPDFRESLSLHDGQELDQFGCSPGLVYGLDLFPLEKIISRWTTFKVLLDEGVGSDLPISTDGPVKQLWRSRFWIPIAGDGNNGYCCIDLDPAAGGQVGQVIKFWNQENRRLVLANSFCQWLSRFAEELINGDYVYSEDDNGIVSIWDVIS